MMEHLVQVIGPTVGVAIVAAGVAVVRTRTNAHRIQVMEEWRMQIEALQLPTCVGKLAQKLEDHVQSYQERFDRNERDHDEIKGLIEVSKNDMIREFHKTNGKV